MSEEQRRAPYAILEPTMWGKPPTHRADCKDCKWSREEGRRSRVIRAGARHIEDSGHRAVVVKAIAIDWIVAVPNLPKYAPRRILGPPSNVTTDARGQR